jgi:hypothetical protein
MIESKKRIGFVHKKNETLTSLVMEALGKFMKAFSKKWIEMKRKSFLKEWGGVNGSNIKKGLTSACQPWLECSKKWEDISNGYIGEKLKICFSLVIIVLVLSALSGN